MRRVGREEALRLLRAVRPDVDVRQVRVASVRAEPDHHPVAEFEFDDGGVYEWDWDRPELVSRGQHLWCSLPGPDGDVVLCVRAETALPEPDVMHSKSGTLRLVRSRFSRPQPTVVDASLVAPADVTQGTGMTEDDALLVLRSRLASMRRSGRASILGAFGLFLPLMQLAGQLTVGEPWLAGVAAAAYCVPGLIASVVYAGPGRRRRRALEHSYADGLLEPVDVVEWRGFGVTVEGRDGRRWRWMIRPVEKGFAAGATVWATPVAEGEKATLVGVRAGGGRPVVVEALEPAAQILPPRAEIQDVVRGH